MLPCPLGGHTRFRILFFLRYVVDIGKSSPNPKFFWNPMKTDKREAYQSSKIGLFSCFWTTPWKIAKNHYLNDKCRFFCYSNVIIISGTTKFIKSKKKFLHPFTPKNDRVYGKITKKYDFSTLSQKNTHLVLINTQKLAVCDF